MLIYLLIVLLLTLVGVAGLQFSYMFYVERLDRERKKHVRDLEKKARRLEHQLETANDKIAEQAVLIEKFVPEYIAEDDSWSEIIDER